MRRLYPEDVFAVLITLIFVAFVIYVVRVERRAAVCESRGGVLVGTSAGRVCTKLVTVPE